MFEVCGAVHGKEGSRFLYLSCVSLFPDETEHSRFHGPRDTLYSCSTAASRLVFALPPSIWTIAIRFFGNVGHEAGRGPVMGRDAAARRRSRDTVRSCVRAGCDATLGVLTATRREYHFWSQYTRTYSLTIVREASKLYQCAPGGASHDVAPVRRLYQYGSPVISSACLSHSLPSDLPALSSSEKLLYLDSLRSRTAIWIELLAPLIARPCVLVTRPRRRRRHHRHTKAQKHKQQHKIGRPRTLHATT